MNLDRALPIFVILCISIGALMGHLWGSSAVIGAAIGLAVGFSPLLLLAIAYGFIVLWRPETPTCMCGKCESKGYEYLGPFSKPNDDTYYYKCPSCGREYRLQNKRFDLRLSKNDFQPYMMISKWGKWRPSTKLGAPGEEV
jgi:hypothetical protein